MASKSLFFLAAITVLVVHRVQRLTSTTILALAGALVSGLHMVFVGGDVAWKPYFRFGYIFNLLILLAYFLTTWSRRAALNVVAVVIAALLIGFVHTDEVPAVGTYWTALPFRTVYLRPSYAVTALGRLPSIAQQASQRSRDLYDDFPEDVLAATGKLLRLVAAPDDLLITTCAGKVVYYSRLTAIDVSNLANRDWRTYDRARRQALAREARYVVFNSNDRGIDDHLRPHTSKRLVAAVHSHFMYPGLYLFVFADTTLSNPPSSIGDRWSYTRHHLPFAGDHIDYYTDELRGSQDIEALLSAYRRLTGSLAPRQSPGPAAGR